MKPLLARLVRSHRERGGTVPVFRGVPLCLFGSEWPGFPSRPRSTPPLGRCAACAARRACGFDEQVPDELLPISEAPLLERWRDYGAAFRRVTGSDAATTAAPLLARILAAYRGPVSLEPSVLLSDTVERAVRFVVFPHRLAPGAAGAAEYQAVLGCIRGLLAEIGADPCVDLLRALEASAPLPVPVGIDGEAGSWRLKVYLRLEEKTAAEKHTVLAAIARGGAALARGSATMDRVALDDLQMLGLVLDRSGLHTVKAYVVGHPTRRGGDGFPPPLASDHPLVTLTGDRALATLDVWCRGARRANKWDCNVREHYLAGTAAARLATELAPGSAGRLGPLLAGPTYRADVVAVGVRGSTVALYLELN